MGSRGRGGGVRIGVGSQDRGGGVKIRAEVNNRIVVMNEARTKIIWKKS